MKKIIILIALIASCIWAFDIKNLSDCTIDEQLDAVFNNLKRLTIKCHSPVEYEIQVDTRWGKLDVISEYIYTKNGKKTDALFFTPGGWAHHEISEQDEYGVYLHLNNQIISSNKLNKLLVKKWEYVKKLKKQIESEK